MNFYYNLTDTINEVPTRKEEVAIYATSSFLNDMKRLKPSYT